MTVDLNALGERLEDSLRAHKALFIMQGTLFIVAGVLAAAVPGAAALNAELLVGVILLMTGVFQFVLTVKSRMHWWSMLSACLSMTIGIVVLWKPLAVLLAFVTLMALFMTLEGICELFLALEFRMVKGWGWMLFSGLVTLLLAILLWIGFPAFDVFYLGWVIAVNLILYGMSLLMLVWRVAS
jgi:uncharacterized membrane protein HdeD (DUF308 family)